MSNNFNYNDPEFLDFVAQELGLPKTQKQTPTNSGLLGDLATDVKIGIQKLPGALVGIGDAINPVTRVTNRAYGNELANAIGEATGFQPGKWAEAAQAEYSPERKRIRSELDAAWENDGMSGALPIIAQNPGHTIGGFFAESIPAMGVGAGIAGPVARGLATLGSRAAAGGMGPATQGVLSRAVGAKYAQPVAQAAGAALGEGSVAAGMSMQNLQDEGVEPSTAANYALATGAGVGALGAVGRTVAGKLGIGDVDTAFSGAPRIATGSKSANLLKDISSRVAKGAFTEGVLEELPQSMWEQALSNIAQDKPWDEGLDRAAVEGMLAGSAMGGVFSGAAGRGLDIEGFKAQEAAKREAFIAERKAQLEAAEQAAIEARVSLVRDNTVDPQLSTNEIIERTLGLNLPPSVKRKDVTAAFNAPLAAPIIVSDPQGRPVTLNTEGDLYAYQNGTMFPETVGRDALGTPISQFRPEVANDTPPLDAGSNQGSGVEPIRSDGTPRSLLGGNDGLGGATGTSTASVRENRSVGDGNANGLGSLNGLPSTQQVAAQAPQTNGSQAGVEQTTAPAAEVTPFDAFRSANNVTSSNKDISRLFDEIQGWEVSGRLTAEEAEAARAELGEIWNRRNYTNIKKQAVPKHHQLTRRLVDVVTARIPSAAATTTAKVDSQQTEAEIVGAILQSMTPMQRRVLELYHTEKLTMDEIGDQLGVEFGHQSVADLSRAEKESALVTSVMGTKRTKKNKKTFETLEQHYAKLSDAEIDDMYSASNLGYTKARVSQLRKEALDAVKRAAEPLGVQPERIDAYFASENNRLQGGADVDTFSAAEVAQSGATMSTTSGQSLVDQRGIDAAVEGEEVVVDEYDGEVATETVEGTSTELTDDYDTFDVENTERNFQREEDSDVAEMISDEYAGYSLESTPDGEDITPEMIDAAKAEWDDLDGTELRFRLLAPWVNLVYLRDVGKINEQEFFKYYGKLSTDNEILRTESAPNVPGVDAKTAQRGDAADTRVQGQSAQGDGESRAAAQGEPIPAEATGRADSQAQNPLEARVANLKASLGEKQGKAIDRFVGRYSSGEISLDRLNAELDNFDAQKEDGTRYSTGAAGSTTVEAVRGKVKPLFFSNSMFDRKVEIVSKPEDLPASILQAASADANMSANPESWTGVQAFVQGGKVYMIADNIAPGRELAVFLHEVGVHLGMNGLIGQENLNRLALQIKKWAIKNDGSSESELAKKALARVKSAQQGGIDMEVGDIVEERVAYFIEEAVLAGINPTAMDKAGGPMQQWFRTLWAAVKTALRKFGLGRIDSLTAQNMVDLAYGAARLELEGTWHGTAADFRNFDHTYMGSGEGAQAFGWGSYVAQRPGIAKGYWKDDVRRKDADVAMAKRVFERTKERLSEAQRIVNDTSGKYDADTKAYFRTRVGVEQATLQKQEQQLKIETPEGSLMRVDVAVTEDEMLDWDAKFESMPTVVQDALNAANESGAIDVTVSGAKGSAIYESLEKQLGSDKAASEYLDSIGIKGIKFLDSQSRGNQTTKPLRDYPKLDELRALIDAEDNLGFDRSIEVANAAVNDGMQAMRDGFDMSPELDAALAEFVTWVKEVPEQTRNLVIFNDKNIQRVVTQVGADRERLKFSVNFSEKLVETLPTDLQDPVASTIATAKSMFGKAGKYSIFTSDLIGVSKFKPFVDAAKKWFDLVNRRETRRTAHEAKVAEIGDAFYKLDDANFRSTWNAIQFMTKNQKWAYQPTWKSEKVTVDAEAKKLYDALSADGKALMDRVFKHGAETLADLRTLVDESVDNTFDGAMKQAKTDAERAAVEKDREKFKRLTGKKLSELVGPYAPMTRVGKYVTVAQSQQYIDALKNGEDVSKLAKDKDHYVVVFSDSQGEADAIKRDLLKTKKFVAENIRARSREEVLRQTDTLPFEAFDKMRNAILDDGGERNATKAKMVKLLNELYLISLADTSARKSELKRNNTSGMEDRPLDMFKAFMSKGMADAHYIGNLALGKEVADAFAEMRQQAAKTGNTKETVGVMDTFNELKKRAEAAATYQEAPVVSRILGFNSMWMLLTKPAYHFYNATQPFMMTLPELTRRHNYTTAANAMVQAYKDLFSIKDINLFSRGHINLHALPADIRDAVIALRDQGKIDITMTQEMGAYIHQGRGKVAKGWQKVDRAFRSVTQKVEMMNRLVSAIAALRLERAAGTPDARALDYAARVVDVTQGNYTNFNAPRLFNATSTNRLLTQFRKFQLIQLGFYYRLMRDSLKGATPEETKAARAALMFTLGHHAILAGAMGLPAASLVALVFGASGDDDEKRDLELWMRKELGGGPMADMLTRGVPAALFNMNISGNVGAGEMMSLMPFTDVDVSSRDGMAKTVLGMMGPTTSHLYNFADAMHFMGQGDIYRGFEVMQPSGIRGAMKSWREASEGVTNRRGDLLVSPEEVDLWASLSKAAGFKTMDDSTRQLVNGAKFEFEKFYMERTTWMKNQYVQAYKEGDDQRITELRQSWNEMQANKRELGFTYQPLANLHKSIQESNKREANTVGGIQVRTTNRKFVEQFVE